LGTELYRDSARADRFLTIDRWQDEQDWRSFLSAFGSAYESLDAQLEGLAATETIVVRRILIADCTAIGWGRRPAGLLTMADQQEDSLTVYPAREPRGSHAGHVP
jgi:hypothetical protein